MGWFETVFVVMVMVFIAFSMRVVAEPQRIAVFRLGRYAGLKGPGMVMVIPYMDHGYKVAIGDRGELMEGGMGKFREFQVPVDVSQHMSVGASIRVVGFTQDRVQVA